MNIRQTAATPAAMARWAWLVDAPMWCVATTFACLASAESHAPWLEPGASSCMELPGPTTSVRLPAGLELMPHQARLLAAASGGHRTFLLADEPGLGKTAQALLAAQAAHA